MNFAIHLLRNEQKVSFSQYDGKDGFPWQVEAHPIMPATHENISGYENLLKNDSASLGGIIDGWGCFSQE